MMAIVPSLANGFKEDGLLFDFRTSHDFSKWSECSDTCRTDGNPTRFGSKAIITSHKGTHSTCAIFFYLLDPLPNGCCFANVEYKENRWDLSDYDGIEAELRRTGSNEWFKFVLDQEHYYEKQFQVCFSQTLASGDRDNVCLFQAPSEFETVRFAFSDFKAYSHGKPVENAPPLNKSNLGFSIQVFGGVFEPFKQSGPGILQINWVRAYKSQHQLF
ncbi:unnamed protein product [Dibothriocephalus latus]|uniref:NADH:ubiquinone oxidoreductase intermediate-associated protein 30 domain-containing protein n=1 Tax=Dibothriocephalus latus TaxID=60516 RepID=A0A3P7MSV8_DIBLA|nr:unnamed protein product [Dibothriocephalus latus]